MLLGAARGCSGFLGVTHGSSGLLRVAWGSTGCLGLHCSLYNNNRTRIHTKLMTSDMANNNNNPDSESFLRHPKQPQSTPSIPKQPRAIPSNPRGLISLFSCVLRDSTPCFVGPSVGPSVRWFVCLSHFTFYRFLRSLA